MQSKSKDAVVQRLQFAAAELEVIGGIADCEGDKVLLEKLHTLNERMQDCIRHVSGGIKSVRKNQTSSLSGFVGDEERAQTTWSGGGEIWS